MQTEKAKSSHFDKTRGFKNQIFPTLNDSQDFFLFYEIFFILFLYDEAIETYARAFFVVIIFSTI